MLIRLWCLALVWCLASEPGAAKPVAATRPDVTQKSATDRRSEGRSGCRFERPSLWTDGAVTWLGGCRDGFANGDGVVVETVLGQEQERFYGRLERGYMSIGVLQTAGGYLAGAWSDGTLKSTLADDVAQRNIVIEAFKAAADAATAVSRSFAKRSDSKASRYYAKQARLLRDQMD